MTEPQACRVCGCTNDTACVDLFDGPCHWVESDLCSACAEQKETTDG